MDEFLTQIVVIDDKPWLRPYTIDDEDCLKDYRPLQVVKTKTQGVRTPRSLKQLRLWWGACTFLSENTEDQHWNTKDKVSDQTMIALGEFDHKRTIVLPDGSVYFHIKSISFKNMKHLEACNVFQRGYEVMAMKMKVKKKGKRPDGTPKTPGDCFVETVIEWLKERG